MPVKRNEPEQINALLGQIEVEIANGNYILAQTLGTATSAIRRGKARKRG
jgi:hypothetical protein